MPKSTKKAADTKPNIVLVPDGDLEFAVICTEHNLKDQLERVFTEPDCTFKEVSAYKLFGTFKRVVEYIKVPPK